MLRCFYVFDGVVERQCPNGGWPSSLWWLAASWCVSVVVVVPFLPYPKIGLFRVRARIILDEIGELESSNRLLDNAHDAEHRVDVSRGEREEILARLSQSEKAQSDWRSRVSKLEEDNAKLRRALEQSMTRLNRMSVDSDFLVDRRIVIKLLVTYFQRNHRKEVVHPFYAQAVGELSLSVDDYVVVRQGSSFILGCSSFSLGGQ